MFTELKEVSIRSSEVREILDIIESSDCESVVEVYELLQEIWEGHYARELELEAKKS